MVVLTAFLRHYPWPTALIASNIQLWLSHSPAGLGRHMVSQEYNISKLLEFEITCIVFLIMYFSFSFDLFPPLQNPALLRAWFDEDAGPTQSPFNSC